MRHLSVNRLAAGLLAAALLMLETSRAQSGDASLTIQANLPGAVVSSNLFGIFFEEINFGGEGGLYAELIRNRTLGNSSNPDYWTFVTTGSAIGQMTTDTSLPINANNARSLKLALQSGTGSAGVANSGYWGIPLQSGVLYDLSFYARATNGFTGSVTARLENSSGGTLYAQSSFSGLTPNWQRFTAALTAGGSEANARLVLRIAQPGTIWLDEISLRPRATFNYRTNGLRSDLANMLAGLRPSFLRFPGGCYVEGNYLTNAFRWKRTIGDPATRPGHWNGVWGYFSTDGLGFHEYLQLSEDLGAEPLFGINAGMAHNEVVPLADMGPYVQDALDAIEYANGGTNTTWGALRAANGHPAPFNLKYLEIGNENGGGNYNDRYTLFYDAIKAAHPNMKIIACVWGGTPWSRPFDLMDEHYYTSPASMASLATKYDSYSRSGPKVFVGEYAVTSGHGTFGNLAAALGEAAFMTGLERNSDIVELACYAPLFANVNGMQWHPNLINFDNSRCFGTPAYYVQKMFSLNRGDAVLPVSVTSTPVPKQGAIGLGTWNTASSYTDLVVTNASGALYQSDFVNSGTNGWTVFNGTWRTNNGVYQQTSASSVDCRTWTGNTNWSDYTFSLRARKDSGSEGFLIIFNWRDANNFSWWNIGGWGNTRHGIEVIEGGSKSQLPQVNGSITTGTWYDIRVVLSGPRIRCYLNNALIHDVNYGNSTLAASATFLRASNQIIVKAVNTTASPLNTTFTLNGVASIAPTASVVQLTSASASDENTLAAPTAVSPVTNVIATAGTNFTMTLPATSLSIFRFDATGISTYTNLLLQFPSPINSGQRVASRVSGQRAGSWVDLTANTNHALQFASANTNIAVVDFAGNVTGVSPGTTEIIASYASLGLFATQSVAVRYVPKVLAHRYSFSESAGTNAADSIGGPAWAGWLPRGGSFGGGQLALAASGQQYLQLPGGMLNNYTRATIETWVTFPNQLPVNCFFFGFGNTNGSMGDSYIFCAPRAGRIAIASGNFLTEQNAYSGTDFSFRTNFHLTAIFDPPGGYVALYTNGTLAAVNRSVTTPLSAVSNVFSFIGRSLYSADPYPDFSLDELRIYDGALSAAEVATAHVLGPGVVFSTAAPDLSVSAADASLTLSWPADHTGWRLQTQTNHLMTGFGTNWFEVTGSATTNSVRLPVDLSSGSVFYRLVYP